MALAKAIKQTTPAYLHSSYTNTLAWLFRKLCETDTGDILVYELYKIFPLLRRLDLSTIELATETVSINQPLPLNAHKFSTKGDFAEILNKWTNAERLLFLEKILKRSTPHPLVDELAHRISDLIPSEKLNLLTLNIWGLEHLSHLYTKSQSRFSALRESLHNLNPDIVLLQEMWTPSTREIINRNIYPFIAHDKFFPNLLRASGLVTISKYPIIEQEFLPFALTAGVEYLVQKGCLYTKIALPTGRILNVFNLHLISIPERINKLFVSLETWNRIRTTQISQLNEWITARSNSNSTTIVGGDFNFPDTIADYATSSEQFGSDLYRNSYPLEIQNNHPDYLDEFNGFTWNPLQNPLTKGPPKAPERMDYLWLKTQDTFASTASLNFRDLNISDHYGVSSSIEFLRN